MKSLKEEDFEMPPINVLMKPASGMCNMSCEYCFYCDEMSKREQESYGFMSEQTLKNIIRKTMLRAEYAVNYAFQGGEPTLRGLDFFKKIIEYENQYNKNHLIVTNSIQTNGYLINEAWCKFFYDHHFLVGISIDGTEKTHNRLRHGKVTDSTYEHVLHATKLMDQYKVEYNVLTVVTKQVAEQIEEIYLDYQKRGWNFQQYIACMDPLDEERGTSEFALHPKEYGKFLIALFQLWYKDWKRGEQPYIRQFENYIGILLGYAPEACEQRGICSLQNVVEADGSVYPCDFYATDENCLGNFNTDNYTVIQENGEKCGFIERSLQIAAKCQNCDYYKLCRGGCQRNRCLDQQTNSYQNYYCESYHMLFEQCLDQMKEIAERIRRN